MESSDDFPELHHWKQVMEFTIEQAALLLSGIDPCEIETVDEARYRSHPRWKQARTYSLAIVTAIRQGVISPVVCRAYVFEDGQWAGWSTVVMKPSDRDLDISAPHTIITRASLVNWVSTERVQFARPRKMVAPTTPPSPSTPLVTIEPAYHVAPIALPSYAHKSEGLEFVEEAIRHFWSTYDEDDPNTAPRKGEIVEYLKSRGASGRLSEAVDLILRPTTMRTAHLRNRKPPTREGQ